MLLLVRGRGGGQRNRNQAQEDDEEEVAAGGTIQHMGGVTLIPQGGDAACISAAMGFEFKPQQWVKTLSEKQLKDLDEQITKYSRRASSDTAARAIAALFEEMKQIEDFRYSFQT